MPLDGCIPGFQQQSLAMNQRDASDPTDQSAAGRSRRKHDASPAANRQPGRSEKRNATSIAGMLKANALFSEFDIQKSSILVSVSICLRFWLTARARYCSQQ
jgi:hypothetical protein